MHENATTDTQHTTTFHSHTRSAVMAIHDNFFFVLSPIINHDSSLRLYILAYIHTYIHIYTAAKRINCVVQ